MDHYWLFSVYFLIGGGSNFIGPNISHGIFLFPELYDKEGRTEGAAASILEDLMPRKNNEKKVTRQSCASVQSLFEKVCI